MGQLQRMWSRCKGIRQQEVDKGQRGQAGEEMMMVMMMMMMIMSNEIIENVLFAFAGFAFAAIVDLLWQRRHKERKRVLEK